MSPGGVVDVGPSAEQPTAHSMALSTVVVTCAARIVVLSVM
jgi:hypothetical protein